MGKTRLFYSLQDDHSLATKQLEGKRLTAFLLQRGWLLEKSLYGLLENMQSHIASRTLT